MNEKEKDNKGLSYGKMQESSVRTAVSGEPPSNAEQAFERESEKPFKSVGERIHNELTYRGVDYAMNAATGVAFAFWASRTKTGNRWFTGPVTGFFQKHIVRPFVRSEEAALEPAKWGTKFAAIMFGGTVTIPPIMALEHKPTKVRIIRSLDEDIYGEDRVKNDPRFQENYDRILQEPKKSFTVGMVTRVIAILPLIAGSMMFPRNLSKYLYDPIADGSRWVFRKANIKPNEFMLKKAPDETGALVTNWEHLHKTIGFDFGLTIGYSFLHEWTYKSMTALLNPKPLEENLSKNDLPELTQEVREEKQEQKHAGQHKEKPSTLVQKEHTHHMERVTEGPAAAAQM